MDDDVDVGDDRGCVIGAAAAAAATLVAQIGR